MPAPVTERKRVLGAATLTERQRIDGHALVVTYRLELTKPRLTAAEANETRKAIVALYDESAHFVFEHEAWSLVDHGKFRDGVAQMTATLKARPSAAREHARFAQMLLRMGDGEGARREGRKAVELAPKDAETHLALGFVLTHDLVGERWTPGHDHAGARKELELAHKLAPKHTGAATELANLLERGTRGELFGAGADLHASAEMWRIVNDLDPSKAHATSLLSTLLFAGDAAGAEKAALDIEPSTERDTVLLAARATLHGADEALRGLQTDNRTAVLQGAAGLLIFAREYDLARRVFAEAGAIPGGATQQAMVAKLKKFDPGAKPSADPEAVGYEVIAEELDPDRPARSTGTPRPATRSAPSCARPRRRRRSSSCRLPSSAT